MRRFLLVLFVAQFLIGFSLNTDHILSVYSSMVNDYNSRSLKNEFVRLVNRELNNLSLYRFYKNKIVGSMEKREFAFNIGDFLDAIYEVGKSQKETDRIAQGLFLAYVSADLQGKNLTVSVVKTTNSFNKAFDSYGRKMRLEMYSLVKHILAYHLGATDTKPPIDLEDLPFKNLGYSYSIKPTSYDYLEDLRDYLESLREEITKIFQELSSKSYENAAEFRRELLKKSRSVMRFFDKKVAEEKEDLARLAVEITPKRANFLWIRFLVYAILLGLGLKFRKSLKWILTVILAAESFYIFTFFNPENLYEGLLYSLAIFFPFSFALMISLTNLRKNIVWNSLGIGLIVSLFIPAYVSVENLSMDRHPELEKSPFYDLLKNDLFMSETSGFRLELGKLTSALSASREETRDTIRNLANFVYKLKDKEGIRSVEVTPNGIYIEFPKMSDYYSHKGFDTRIEDFRKLRNLMGDYIAQEETRKRKVHKSIENLLKKIDRIVSYSAKYLREDFRNYVEKTFEKKIVLTPLLEEVLTHFDVSDEAVKPSVYVFQTFTGLSAVMVIMLMFFAYTIGIRNMALPVITASASVFLLFKREVTVFVQHGIEPLKISGGFTHIPLLELVALAMAFFMLYEILRGRVRT